MSTIYHLDGKGDPYGPQHFLSTLAEPMTRDHRDYWRMPSFRGSENSFVEQLAQGAVLQHHWPVDNPELAFPALRFDFKSEPYIVPDIMVGRRCPTVSSKARAVIEKIDPDQNQFFPLTIVDGQGAPWTEQDLFAMVPGRQIDLGEPILNTQNRPALPDSAGSIANHGLSIIEMTPGLAKKVEEYWFWTTTFDTGSVYWNESAMRALQRARLVGIKVMERGQREVDLVVNQIWFRELQ